MPLNCSTKRLIQKRFQNVDPKKTSGRLAPEARFSWIKILERFLATTFASVLQNFGYHFCVFGSNQRFWIQKVCVGISDIVSYSKQLAFCIQSAQAWVRGLLYQGMLLDYLMFCHISGVPLFEKLDPGALGDYRK